MRGAAPDGLAGGSPPTTMSTPDDQKIAQLQALVDADPDPTGLFMLAKLLIDAGRHDEAATAAHRAVTMKPDYSAAYKLWGDALRKAGRTVEAAAVYRDGIARAEARGDLQTVREMKALLAKIES